MFNSCRLLLQQKINLEDVHPQRYVQVRLVKPQLPPGLDAGITESAMYEWIVAFTVRYQWWGEWRLVGQSGSQDVNAIGTAPPEARFWRYSATQRQLEFVEVGDWQGGGLKFGEAAREAKVAIALFDAKMSGRGFEPFDASGTGRGSVTIGSAILQARRAVYWERMMS